MSGFAFRISLVDMVRKLRYRYEQPVDYLDNFVSRLYTPGGEIGFELSEDHILLKSNHDLDPGFIEEIKGNGLLAISAIMPPVSDYQAVEILTNDRRIGIDKKRNISIEPYGMPKRGFTLDISRKTEDTIAEVRRLKRLYSNSDLEIAINGAGLEKSKSNSHQFSEEGFSGEIFYNPYSRGELHFFSAGRYISSKLFLPGIDVLLYNHPFPATITKTRTITEGRMHDEYARLESLMPRIVLAYLKSDEAKNLRIGSEASFQTMLRSVLMRYSDDEAIASQARKEIIFADSSGRFNPKYSLEYISAHNIRLLSSQDRIIYRLFYGDGSPAESDIEGIASDAETEDGQAYDSACRDVEVILGICKVLPSPGDRYVYSKEGILHVPEAHLRQKAPISIALCAVPAMESKRRKRLAKYRRLAEIART